ncbi:hypothetical protein ACIF9R_09720 [Streptomyces sp. NPDC086080]|uniref:hypothetical protein n=1 Tax=Streptomyces sp. NPDC086080 TaxID=3365748 RepID=UPI0037D5215B
MASQKKPPAPDGPDGTGGSSVRRAVSLGPAAADPGAMPVPAARRTAEPEPEPEESGPGEAEAEAERESARPAPDTAESTTAPTGGAAGEPATTATVSGAPESTAVVRAESDAEARGVGGAAGTAAAAAAGADGDGPPSGKPKKPLLAAAGIAGVVLLAVPLLIWATDDARQNKKDDVAVAAGSDTLLDEEPLEVPKGEYAPAAPTPTSTPKPKASAKKPAVKQQPVVGQGAPVSSPASSDKPLKKTVNKAQTKVEDHEPPKLPPNTAAYAVQRLAASNPGRHICYRVHVKGAGWTAPVCDGGTAGHEGKGRPITAINISVADVKRVNGNEFIQKDGWTTPWSGAADGTDLVLGSAASNAPNLSGFTIGAEVGNVCQNHKLGQHDWGGLRCETSEGWIFGGSTSPDVWLEAVRFTV